MRTVLYACLSLAALSIAVCALVLPRVVDDAIRREAAIARWQLTFALAEAERAALADSAAWRAALASESAAWRRESGRLRADLRPVLAEYGSAATAAKVLLSQGGPLVGDARSGVAAVTDLARSVDAMAGEAWPDVLAGIQTGIVAERSIAEAAGAVERAAPAVAEAAARNVPAILDDSRATARNLRRSTGLPATIARAVWRVIKRIVPGL